MTTTEPRLPDELDESTSGPHQGGPRDGAGWHRQQWYLVTVIVVAIVLAAGVLAVARHRGSTHPTTTTSATSTSTSAPSTTSSASTSVPPPSAARATAVWPTSTAESPYTDPVAAARAFAVEFAGYANPVMGTFRAGDSRSGEVDVRKNTSGPVSTVLVRQLDATGHWWVIGAVTDSIRVTSPSALDTITSPVRVRGTSTAFEGTVRVEVREDGSQDALGRGHFNGGSMGDFGPFDSTLAFARPTAAAGAVMFSTASMEDGGIMEMSVIRVRFGTGGTPSPESATCGSYTPYQPATGAGEMLVTVWFTCTTGTEGRLIVGYRAVPATSAVLRASLQQLLSGPSADERSGGVTSWFSPATAGMLAGVTIDAAGRATVDFHDLRPAIPNASTSAGSQMLLAQLDATVFQFPSVHSAVYRIEGSCEAFTEWLQIGGCEPRTR